MRYGNNGAPGGSLGLAGVLVLAAGLLIVGRNQRALAVIQHFGGHGTLAKSRFGNRLLTCVSGFLVGIMPYRYEETHAGPRGHHAGLGNPAIDPDIAQYFKTGVFRRDPATFVRSVIWDLCTGKSGFMQAPYVLFDRLVPSSWKLSPRALLEYTGLITMWAAIWGLAFKFGWADELALVWVLPWLFVYLPLGAIIETAEHAVDVLRSNPLLKSRNRDGNWFENWLFSALDEGLHLTHHCLGSLPWHSLRKAHLILMQDDKDYASANMRSGGLLWKGPNGQPPLWKVIGQQLQNLKNDGII